MKEKKITKKEIEQIQQDWGDGVVKIGKLYLEKKDFEQAARAHVNSFYGYKNGPVLFKPTKASEIQFRNTEESAVSYFVGNNPDYPEDKGFALQPWTNVRFENSGFVLNHNLAFAMGNYYFTDLHGTETKVEYTFGFFRTIKGNLKINLHHSSLPYNH